MKDQGEPLARIAEALERLAPARPADTDWQQYPAYIWDGAAARPVKVIKTQPLDLLQAIDMQKARVSENIARHAKGYAAHDMLLWGARGMGKSALIRAATAFVQRDAPAAIALVQVASDAIPQLVNLFAELGAVERNFVVYLDDLGFAEDDSRGPRLLRSWLEGGVEARPANIRLAVTANRRAILPRQSNEQDDPINPRDVVDDKLALADRFGLSLGFHNCDQEAYLAIIAGYAAHYGLEWNKDDALEWARRRGARSGRTAWQFVVELAGQSGRAV